MIGHKVSIEADGEGLARITVDGKDLSQMVRELEFRHSAETRESYLRIVGFGKDLPMPDFGAEEGSVRTTEDGHIEIVFE